MARLEFHVRALPARRIVAACAGIRVVGAFGPHDQGAGPVTAIIRGPGSAPGIRFTT